MVTSSFINRLSQAIDQIEKRSQPPRPWKVVKMRRGYNEDPDVAQIATTRSIPRIGTRMSVSSTFAMMRNWPTRARLRLPGKP